jgi:putative oligomerization/nucleic acid binding protein
MGFHIYTDHWWRDPKHAITTEATLVEVKPPKRPTGTVTSGPYNPSPSGHFQEVLADVTDPGTGQMVRAHGDLYFTLQPFQVGQRLRVRWSAKRKEVDLFSEKTAPEDEWSRQASPGAGTPGWPSSGIGAAPLSGAELSVDQAARVQQVLGTLGLGDVTGVRVVHAEGAAVEHDPIDQLEKLAELRKSGVLTDAEFEQQKHRILGEQ